MRVTFGKFPGIRYSRVPVRRAGLFSTLFGSERDRDLADTIALYHQVKAAHAASPFADEAAVAEFDNRVVAEIQALAPSPSPFGTR